MLSPVVEVLSNPIQIEITGQPDVILEVQQRSVEIETVAAQGMAGAQGVSGSQGVQGTQGVPGPQGAPGELVGIIDGGNF